MTVQLNLWLRRLHLTIRQLILRMNRCGVCNSDDVGEFRRKRGDAALNRSKERKGAEKTATERQKEAQQGSGVEQQKEKEKKKERNGAALKKERKAGADQKKEKGSSYIISKMAYEINEQKKIGLGLIGFGIFFTFLGVILFFDRGLLALGNIFCLAGVAFLLGWRPTLQLFTNRSNYKGSVSFLLGLFFIFVRWPIVGIILEIYGCIVLFGGFWPSVKVFCYQIPVFGWILQYPVLLLDRLRRSFG
ncbi:hypothetical protein F0562_006049 [Nyssa sinensis]|uniref:Vesicle transport protein n=1 Tax=Nyssa sinensis TaxID=561372 RepID=A0A5J5AKX8_9ASTE|nr:hypothetical protein F0562_006049 [Nyssa sinensis]